MSKLGIKMIKVDQSEEFRRSGMVLITDPRADYYLKNRNNTQKICRY